MHATARARSSPSRFQGLDDRLTVGFPYGGPPGSGSECPGLAPRAQIEPLLMAAVGSGGAPAAVGHLLAELDHVDFCVNPRGDTLLMLAAYSGAAELVDLVAAKAGGGASALAD